MLWPGRTREFLSNCGCPLLRVDSEVAKAICDNAVLSPNLCGADILCKLIPLVLYYDFTLTVL
jgi:hypothetical protein